MFRILPLLLVAVLPIHAQPFGIDTRVPNTQLLIPEVPEGEMIPEGFPKKLSDIPALLAAGLGQDQTALGIYPYAPSAKLWSDGALKERFLALPGSAQMVYRARTGWDFPDGTIIIKNFLMPQDFRDHAGTAKRIETRLLIRNAGSWHGFSYRWNETETDATLLEDSDTQAFSLVDESGATIDYDWYYPRRTECFRCHTDVANSVLGLNTAQINADYAYPASGVTDNQLRTFEHIGLFAGGLPGEPCALPKAPDPTDETEPLEARALAYLQANCAMCHQPRGPTPTSIDLRWGTRMEAREMFDVYTERFDLGLPEPRIFSPGDPDNSVLVARMETLDFHRMPPLATSRVDVEGVSLIRSWITEQTEIDGNMHAFHSADTSADYRVDLSELLRVIQFYNSGGFGCDVMGEDGYSVGATGQRCTPHAADYAPTDWMLSMSEVLRVIQFYNMDGYTGAAFSESEDGYLPVSACAN